MSRTRWAAVLALYGIVAVGAMLVLGGQLPPCFGTVPTGEVTPQCYAAWQASRSWLDRLFDTPLGGVAVFLVLALATWAVTRLAGRRRHSSGAWEAR